MDKDKPPKPVGMPRRDITPKALKNVRAYIEKTRPKGEVQDPKDAIMKIYPPRYSS